MALNGEAIVKSNWSTDFGLKFVWNVTGQNISENYSDINVNMYAYFEKYATIAVGSRSDSSITIANENRSITAPSVSKLNTGAMQVFLGSFSKRVYHNSDGTLPNVIISGYWPIRSTINNIYRSNVSGSINTGEINKIPRASQLTSSPNFTLGNSLPINIQRYYDGFHHTIELKINNNTIKTINNVATSTLISFTTTEINNLYVSIPNSSNADVKIICKTYDSSNNLIGSSEQNGKMYLDEGTNKPTFNGFNWMCDSITNTLTGWSTAITDDNGLSILTKTKYTITCNTATSKNGSSIAKYEAVLNGKTYSSNTNVITVSEAIQYSDILKVSAVDSRGFKTTLSKSIQGQAYSNPNPTSASIKRMIYPNNTKVQVSLTVGFTKSSTLNNIISAKYRYKATTSSTWSSYSNLTVSVSGTTATINQQLSTFALSTAYDFEIQITDSFGSINISYVITKDIPELFIGNGVVEFIGKKILDYPYPIGAIYQSSVPTSPATLFGGTWVALTDRFLIGAGGSYSAGATGGATTHKHLQSFAIDNTIGNWNQLQWNNAGIGMPNGYATDSSPNYNNINNTPIGSSKTMYIPYTRDGSSLGPYRAVYMWYRSA